MGGLREKYASDWQDDQTMDVLFSPFRENRDVNPQSWDSKITFWKDTIIQHCTDSNKVVINSKILPQSFARKGKTPVCLQTVIQGMQQSGDIIPLSEFEKAAPSGWLSWGFGLLVKRPLSWSYGAFVKKPLTAMFGGGTDSGEDFVMVNHVKVSLKKFLLIQYFVVPLIYSRRTDWSWYNIVPILY